MVLIVCLVIIVWQFKGQWRRYKRRFQAWWQGAKTRLPRQWKPKSPLDCPCCQAGEALSEGVHGKSVAPWSSKKSKQGRRKQLSTEGYACLNRSCPYFGVRDEAVHALVGNGKRSKDWNIRNCSP
jgi:hypothetical protein